MAVDEQRFGELIGTVGALVTAVADMKGAVIPALRTQEERMTKFTDLMRRELADHNEKDEVVHKVVADMQDLIYGDGTADDLGMRKEVSRLVKGNTRLLAFIAGVAVAGGIAGHKLGVIVDKFW